MKAVLISIQPKWCELIASGKKTVEVRKTKPKIATPFKVYIYETKGRTETPTFIDEEGHEIYQGRGQVIGEFVCSNIAKGTSQLGSCLSMREISEYANGKEVYGWYISNLVIYDKPKELSEFRIVDNEAVKRCEHRERVYNNPDYTNGAFLPGSYVCNKDEPDWCTKCKTKPLKRPPQSWCYVEEVQTDDRQRYH